MLQLTRGATLLTARGFSAPEVERTYSRARDLSEELDDPGSLAPGLYGLWNFWLTRSEFSHAHSTIKALAAAFGGRPDRVLSMQVGNAQGWTELFAGDVRRARLEFARAIESYDPTLDHDLLAVYAEDPAIGCHQGAALAAQLLGDPAEADRHVGEAMHRAEIMDWPYGMAQSLWAAAVIMQIRDDPAAVRGITERSMEISRQWGFPFWGETAHILHGWARARLGQAQEGLAEMGDALAAYGRMGVRINTPYMLTLWAEAHASVSGTRSRELLAEAERIADETGETWHRLTRASPPDAAVQGSARRTVRLRGVGGVARTSRGGTR
jgi:predicted ATPase